MTKEEAKAKYGMTTEEITENFSIERISSTYASCVYELTRKNKDVEWPSREACLILEEI